LITEVELSVVVVAVTRFQDGYCDKCSPDHQSVTFEINGISRSCANQLVRHRMASYSQESMRYVDMSNLPVVIPPSLAEDGREAMLQLHAAASETYRRLRATGVRKEDARLVLGLGVATRIVVTMQLHWLKRFWKLRHDRAAQWEIRALADKMLLAASEYFPDYFRRETNELLGINKL